MKSHKKSSTNKLVTRFDNELKMLLLNDLNSVKEVKSQIAPGNAQARMQPRLSIA